VHWEHIKPLYPAIRLDACSLQDAKHPAAAALFAEWALGPGQAAYAASGYRSPRRDVKAPDGDFRAIDEERLYKERDRWIAGWKRLITLGQPAGG
jgi:ABC-type Fe3+ transport system substrate-binding protein